MKQLGEVFREVFEERVLVFGVFFNNNLELLILHQGNVSRKHHKLSSCFVRVLERTVPFLLNPFLLHKIDVVFIIELERIRGPGSAETASIGMAAAQVVSAAQSDNGPVVKAHAVENIAEVLCSLCCIRKAAILWAVLSGFIVAATERELNLGSSTLFDRHFPSVGPNVSEGYVREFLLDGSNNVTHDVESCIRAICGLGLEPHSSTVAATSLGFSVIGSRRMPRQAHSEWAAVSLRVDHGFLHGRAKVRLLLIGLSGESEWAGHVYG
mmetsp:Transcript_6740/g.11140  ORF Transcript_6740/g.11140 Transcript_6740/m.11140 type:complete len:268 (+) Transcript_6740:193-996(+)